MPLISQRGIDMPSSPIRKLVPYSEAAKKKGIKIYHLNIGQPDIVTPKIMLDAVKNANIKVLEYSHSAGNESYRLKVVEYYKKIGIQLDLSDVLITTGGSEALLFAFISCLNPGDEVIVTEPFYANYHGFAIEVGIKIVPVTSYIENGFALPDIQEFEKKITPKTKAIIITNPNNPTGYVYTKNELELLKSVVIKYNLFLFSDEAYRDFSYNEAATSVLSLDGLDEHAVILDTISKRYSACGGRIGFLISRNKNITETALKLAQARLSPPSFAQIAGEAALDLPADYFTATKAEYQKRRDLIVERLNKIKGVKCPLPNGAFYVMAELPIKNSDDFCQWILEKFTYKNSTVMMAPASGFYINQEQGANQVRLAYVLNCEDINSAMDCLEIALQTYNQ